MKISTIRLVTAVLKSSCGDCVSLNESKLDRPIVSGHFRSTLDNFLTLTSISACVYMAGTFVILIWPLWALSNQPNSSSLMHPTFMYKGIWLECGSTLSGDYLCDNYVEPLFNLPRNLMKSKDSESKLSSLYFVFSESCWYNGRIVCSISLCNYSC